MKRFIFSINLVSALGLTISVLVFWSVASPVHAQQYIEPTSPSGGSTAWPLNSSSNAQVKRGTLIIGESGGNARLCLNTNNPTDPVNCISSWANAGNFVSLKNFDPTSGYLPSDLRAYSPADTGYARIKATGNNLYTLIVEANYNPSAPATATALIATDGGNANNYAANFQGKVFVGFPSALANAKLCLNGEFTIDTSSGDSSFGKGCITAWSDITPIAAAGTYVLLQPTNGLPSPQSGQAALSGAVAVASSSTAALVIGAPASGTPISVTCGDGICNALECSINTTPSCTSASANYCPADCDRTAPGPVVLSTEYVINKNIVGRYFTVSSIDWVLPSDADTVGTRVIRTTSNPSTGPNGGGGLVLDLLKPTNNFSDATHLSFNTYYYYTFYAYDGVGNYSAGAQIRMYVSSGTGGGGGGGPVGGDT